MTHHRPDSQTSLPLRSLPLWFALAAGCVEAPDSHEFDSIDSIEIGADETDSEADSLAHAEVNETVQEAPAAEPVSDDGWKAVGSSQETIDKLALKEILDDEDVPAESPRRFPEPSASVPTGDSVTPPVPTETALQPVPQPRLIPGELAAAPAPASTPPQTIESPIAAPTTPSSGAPVAKPSESLADVSSALPVEPKGTDQSMPAGPEPTVTPTPAVTPTRPPSLIVISPKKIDPKPSAAPAPLAVTPGKVAAETSQKVESGKSLTESAKPDSPSPLPAVVLPSSTASEANMLAKLDQKLPAITVPEPSSAATNPTTASPESSTPSSPTTPSEIPSNSPPSAVPPEGFVSLWNGVDLSGWSIHDGKRTSWKVAEGAVSCTSPGGGWLQSESTYSDFELQFEYRLSPGGNSGVSLRYPGTGNPSLDGLEIQLIDDMAEKYRDLPPQQATGSLYFAVAPQSRSASKAAGEWNSCVIHCEGSRIRVSINGQDVNDIDLGQLSQSAQHASRKAVASRSPVGTIAFQSHSTPVAFRNIYLKDLTQSLASGVRGLDLRTGEGESVAAGSQVTVHYVGHLSSGKKFASSVDKGKPATVSLKDAIPGWREGIIGMKVGGKRRLVVSPEMAYGVKGFKEVIPPNSTLVYEIELLGFQPVQSSIAAPQSASAGSSNETK